MKRSLPIYLDAHSGAPLLTEAASTMRHYLDPGSGLYANPQSELHRQGQLAGQAIEKARKQIAELLGPGTRPDEIVFTSCATESIQIAFRRAIFAQSQPGSPKPQRGDKDWPVIVTWNAEHRAGLDAAEFHRRNQNAEIVMLPCDHHAYYPPEALEQELARLRASGRTHILVSALWASNEVGTVQNIRELARISLKHGALFHSDATQAIGWIETRPNSIEGLTFLSAAGHKLGGPSGTGILWVRRRGPGTLPDGSKLESNFQASFRSGTLPAMAITGFGAAAIAFRFHRAQWIAHALKHRELLRHTILSNVPQRLHPLLHWQGPPYTVSEVGAPGSRLPNNLSLGLEAIPGQEIYGHLAPHVATSAGSACRSSSGSSSHVLKAMGIPPDRAQATLRLGLYPRIADEDVARAGKLIGEAITKSAS